MTQPTRIAVLAAAVVLSATAACSAPSPAPAPKPSTLPNATAAQPGPVEQAQQAALAAYTGMWTDYANASLTADYKDQRLTKHATNAALGEMVRSLYRMQQQGIVSKGAPTMAPTIVDATPANVPTQVDIKDCASDVHWLQYVTATGRLRDSVPGGNRLVTARVEKQGGLWRVTNYQVRAVGSC